MMLFCQGWYPFLYSNIRFTSLMTSATSFGNTDLEFLNLPLGSKESAQLHILAPRFSVSGVWYPFLSQFTSSLVLVVSQQFNNPLLIGSSSSHSKTGSLRVREGGVIAYPTTSLMMDRTALVFWERYPLRRDGRGGSSRRWTTWPLFMPTAMPRPTNVSAHLQEKTGNFAGIVVRPLFINPSIKLQKPIHATNVSVEMIDIRRTQFYIGKGIRVPVLGALGAMAVFRWAAESTLRWKISDGSSLSEHLTLHAVGHDPQPFSPPSSLQGPTQLSQTPHARWGQWGALLKSGSWRGHVGTEIHWSWRVSWLLKI